MKRIYLAIAVLLLMLLIELFSLANDTYLYATGYINESPMFEVTREQANGYGILIAILGLGFLVLTFAKRKA